MTDENQRGDRGRDSVLECGTLVPLSVVSTPESKAAEDCRTPRRCRDILPANTCVDVSSGCTEPVRIPISGELDLHTFQPRETGRVVDAYIEACLEKGIGEVRIIHGKGTGTLRETVHAHLRRHPSVAGFRLGDERSGGWGATIARLRGLETARED